MTVLPIRLFPDPILRESSKPVTFCGNPAIQKLLQQMIKTLYAQPGGIGIAAPQVGKDKRIIVIDVSPKDSTKRLEVMINPTIRHLEGKVLSREGCMSLPDYTANVKRAAGLTVHWTDPMGRKHNKAATGIEAICLQHEVDHLNGILFIDRVVSLKTDVFPRRQRGQFRQI